MTSRPLKCSYQIKKERKSTNNIYLRLRKRMSKQSYTLSSDCLLLWSAWSWSFLHSLPPLCCILFCFKWYARNRAGPWACACALHCGDTCLTRIYGRWRVFTLQCCCRTIIGPRGWRQNTGHFRNSHFDPLVSAGSSYFPSSFTMCEKFVNPLLLSKVKNFPSKYLGKSNYLCKIRFSKAPFFQATSLQIIPFFPSIHTGPGAVLNSRYQMIKTLIQNSLRLWAYDILI